MKKATKIENLISLPQAKVAIIQSKWHKSVSDMMVKKCCEVLLEAKLSKPEVHLLPGALELPLAARDLARKNSNLEAIIAFGIIVKGETDHYEVVRDECMRGLSAVMFECDIPIIIEVLPVSDIKFAVARSSDDDMNKGIEAAIAAIEMIHWRRTNHNPKESS